MLEEKIIKGKVRFKRDTTENWELNKDYIPDVAEPCFDTDLKKLKIGDGTTPYENLPYLSDAEFKQVNAEISLVKESVKLNSIRIDELDKFNAISVGGTLLNIINKTVDIPIATNNSLGVVCGSDEISIGDSGNININQINIGKIIQDKNQVIIFNNGNSNDY